MKKRVFVGMIIVFTFFSLLLPVFAQGDYVVYEATALEALGLLQGNGEGEITAEVLNQKMDRFTAACMILKLSGTYEEALNYQGSNHFQDWEQLNWGQGRNLLDYLKDHPSYGFSGLPDGSFQPEGEIDQSSVLKALLTVLGYQQGKDYSWSQIKEFAAQKGIELVWGEYTVEGFAKNVFTAMKVRQNHQETTLAQKIAAGDAEKQEILARYDMLTVQPVDLQVVSLRFINLKQLEIKFNIAPEVNKAEEEAGYVVYTDQAKRGLAAIDAAVQSDGRTVIVTLADGGEAVNGSEDNRVEIGIQTGLRQATVIDGLSALDSVYPSVESVEATGVYTFEIFFSEPVRNTRYPIPFVLDGQEVPVGSTMRLSGDRRSIRIALPGELAEGRHRLTVLSDVDSNVEDFAGYRMLPQDVNFTVKKDEATAAAEILRVVSDTDRNATIITIRFSKDMEGTSEGVTYLAARLLFNSKEGIRGNWKQGARFREYEITFQNTILTPGSHLLYLTNQSQSARARDTWGVPMPNRVLQFQVLADFNKPEVQVATTGGKDQIIVAFTKEVTDAQFVVKNGKKEVIPIEKINTKGEKWILTLASPLEGGVYTLEISGAQDKTPQKNKMNAVTIKLPTYDKVAPVMQAATISDGSPKSVRVVFSEEMGGAVRQKSNWTMAGNRVVSVVQSIDKRSVLITFEKNVKPGMSIQVNHAADLSGNLVSETIASATIVASAKTIVPTLVQLTDVNEVTLTYKDQLIDGITDGVYEVRMGNLSEAREISEIAVTISGGSDTIVKLTLSPEYGEQPQTTVNTDDSDRLLVKVIAKDFTTPKVPVNQYGIKLDTTSIITRTGLYNDRLVKVEDKCPPVIKETEEDWQALTMKIIFTEEIDPASVYLDRFAIEGRNIIGIIVESNAVVLYLDREDGPFIPDETLRVTLKNGIRDTDGNTLVRPYVYEKIAKTS